MRRLWVPLSVLVLVGSATAFAATTGRLEGLVNDNEGIALPGVTVTLSSVNLIGGPKVAISDADGGFAFNLLPAGDYKVEANLSGYQPAVAEAVHVTLDRTASVTFSMVPDQFVGEIEVTADVPVVDTTQVNSSVNFDQQYLQNAAIGSAGRKYQIVLAQAAGATGGTNPNVFGGNLADNRYLIDGLNTTDPVTGTFGTNFNFDAIQEMSFQTGGFEAEFGQATGGIVNLVTKSGGNEFSGSLDARYRDESFIENGDHFNRDEQTSSSRIISATLGGPILRDKMWFFASGEDIRTRTQDVGAPVVYGRDGWNAIGKLTWQVADNHRTVLKYSTDPASLPGSNSSSLITRDSSSTQDQGGDIWGAELNSVLSESVLLNAQIGLFKNYIDVYPTFGGADLMSHNNQDTGILYNNFDTYDLNDRFRDEYRLNTSVFVDDLLGSHEFKLGGEYSDMLFQQVWYYTAEAAAYDRNLRPGWEDMNGDGYITEYLQFKEPMETAHDSVDSRGELWTAFLQDTWRPHANLTLKPGVRLDTVTMSNHIREQVADMDLVQPRIGVAWDITGNSRHVLRASWGRFMDSTALSIPSRASGVVEMLNSYATLEYYCNAVGICDVATLENILGDSWTFTSPEGYEFILFPRPGGTSAEEPSVTVDQLGFGNLKAPYAEELIAAYEVQLGHNTSLELTYVDKEINDAIEDTCGENSWNWDGSVPEPSFDDPSTWTSSTGCTQYVISNVDWFRRTYTGYIARLETRQERFHVMGSYTWSESKGNYSNVYSGGLYGYSGPVGDYFPMNFYNQDGYLADDRRHRVKLNGYLLLPYDFTVGIDGYWESQGRLTAWATCSSVGSATPEEWDLYGLDPEALQYCFTSDGEIAHGGVYEINLEPAGSTRTPSRWSVDLQVSKGFKLGRFNLQGILTVENLLDRENPNDWNEYAFRVDADDNYVMVGQPIAYDQPRRYELGFRLEF